MAIYDGPTAFCEGPEKAGLIDPAGRMNIPAFRNATGGRELWSTEFGWSTTSGYRFSCTELAQARYIVRSALLQLASGLKRVMPHTTNYVPWWGPLEKGFSMNRADLSPKPSMVAYTTLAQTVDDLPYAGRFDYGLNHAVLAFSNGTDTVLVLWSAQGSFAFSPTSLIGLVRGVDAFGAPLSASGTSVSLTIGESPIYLSFTASTAQLAAALSRTLLTGAPATFSVWAAEKPRHQPASARVYRTRPAGSQNANMTSGGA